MSVSTALEIIHSHPESLFSNKQEGNWHSIFRGFRKLIESLVHRLEKAGVHFFNLFKLAEISEENDFVKLIFLKEGCEYIRVFAKKCVLALPLSKIKHISMPWKSLDKLYPYIADVPLFKCFLNYNDAWWKQEGLDARCFITENECQKIYFDCKNKNIFFYCDSDNAAFWNNIKELKLI